VAEELIARDRVNVLMGTFRLPTSAWRWPTFAAQRKILFVASEPLTDKIVWENGNR
jgi:branched-chain amino acid transport system substrate-binding protein